MTITPRIPFSAALVFGGAVVLLFNLVGGDLPGGLGAFLVLLTGVALWTAE